MYERKKELGALINSEHVDRLEKLRCLRYNKTAPLLIYKIPILHVFSPC